MKAKAVIFDMDGTMVDNMSFHQQAWRAFVKKYGKNLSDDEMKQRIFGRDNRSALTYIFGDSISDEDIKKYGDEKEVIYRELYKPHLKPVPNLIDFIDMLNKRGVDLAIATSANKENADFILNGLGIKDYFKVVIDADMVSVGKPAPDIYLKAAKELGVDAGSCIVLEDSMSGIESGKSAGMKVIAITVTHNREELSNADVVADDFIEIDEKDLCING